MPRWFIQPYLCVGGSKSSLVPSQKYCIHLPPPTSSASIRRMRPSIILSGPVAINVASMINAIVGHHAHTLCAITAQFFQSERCTAMQAFHNHAYFCALSRSPDDGACFLLSVDPDGASHWSKYVLQVGDISDFFMGRLIPPNL